MPLSACRQLIAANKHKAATPSQPYQPYNSIACVTRATAAQTVRNIAKLILLSAFPHPVFHGCAPRTKAPRQIGGASILPGLLAAIPGRGGLTHCSVPEKLWSVSDDDVSSVPVEVRLLRVQRVTGRSTLKWLFDVQIDIQGVELEVRGCQCRGSARGALSVRMPQFRGGDGRWLPALILPDSVMSAVGDAFVE